MTFLSKELTLLFLNDQDVIVAASHRIILRLRLLKIRPLWSPRKWNHWRLVVIYRRIFFYGLCKSSLVDRVVELQREIIKIEHKAYVNAQLSDGDMVEAKNVTDKYTNRISVSGEVYLPGNYPLKETPTLSALLKSARGSSAAYSEVAILYRSKQDLLKSNHWFDRIVNNTQDVQLQPNDSQEAVIKTSTLRKRLRFKVANEPGDAIFQGCPKDLILIANGFQDRATQINRIIHQCNRGAIQQTIDVLVYLQKLKK